MEIKAIRDSVVISLVERISTHYQNNISSRFIRPVLLQMGLEKPIWDLIDSFTSQSERYREFVVDELYRQIAAMARFVAVARRDLAPSIKSRVGSGGATGQETVLRDMAVATFPANINVLAENLNQLYDVVVKIDQADNRNGRKPIWPQISELADVKRNLGF
jgi:hypothetical protein